MYARPVFLSTQGFGRMLSEQLLDDGYSVVALCLSQRACDELTEYAAAAAAATAASLPAARPRRGRVLALVCDVTNAQQLAAARLRVDAATTALHAIVNNAGIGNGSLFDWNSLADYRAVMEVNFFAGVQTLQHFWPLLLEAPRGTARIVNMTSIAGTRFGICPRLSD